MCAVPPSSSRMPSCLRFLEDFLLPALNEGRYGDLLKWDARESNVFLLKWMHKGGTTWTEEDTVVFQGWDRLKGHYRPHERKYLCQSKQRFRSTLYKLDQFEELKPVALNAKCYYKRYRIKSSSTYKGRKLRKNTQGLQRVPSVDNKEVGMDVSLPAPHVLRLDNNFETVIGESFHGVISADQLLSVLQASSGNWKNNTGSAFLDADTIAEQFQHIDVALGEQFINNHARQPMETIPNAGERLNEVRRINRDSQVFDVANQQEVNVVMVNQEINRNNQENLTPLQNMLVNSPLDDSYLNYNIPLDQLLYMTFPASPYEVSWEYESDEATSLDCTSQL